MEPKVLILIRHAHRDTNDREADNGLSDKGKRQAQALLRHFEGSSLGVDAQAAARKPARERPALLSSPKRRCVETLAPIARKLNLELAASPLLLEQRPGESSRELERRVGEFIAWWRDEAPPITIVCSHGDWLPLCVARLVGARVEFRKGAWAEIGVAEQDRQPVLRWLIQGFRQSVKASRRK